MCVCVKWSLIHLLFLLLLFFSNITIPSKWSATNMEITQLWLTDLFLLLFKSLCCLKICYIQFCPMGKLVVILCWFLFFCNSECVTCVHAFMFHLKPQPYLVEHLHWHLHAANNLLMFWFSQCRSDDEDKMLLCLMCFMCRNQE